MLAAIKKANIGYPYNGISIKASRTPRIMDPPELSVQILRPSSIHGRLYFPERNLDYLPFEDGSNKVSFVVCTYGDESRA